LSVYTLVVAISSVVVELHQQKLSFAGYFLAAVWSMSVVDLANRINHILCAEMRTQVRDLE